MSKMNSVYRPFTSSGKLIMSENASRMNISIPAELKHRMDAVASEINWSAVAVEAFKGKLLELQNQKKAGTIEEVIARMRAADELDKNTAYQAGRQAGERWVREAARPRQLRDLERLLGGDNRGDERGALEAVGFSWKAASDDTNASLTEQTDFVRGCARSSWRLGTNQKRVGKRGNHAKGNNHQTADRNWVRGGDQGLT